MAKDTKSPFLLSYHDVSSSNLQLVSEELEILGKWGFPRWTLLVIPNCPSDKLAEFRMTLSKYRDEGHELCLHGFEHVADSSLQRNIAGKIALKLTGGEAEFAGLDRTQSKNLLEQAIRAWDRLGVGRAEGFVPPTWHAPEFLADLALDVGWTFYEGRFAIQMQSESKRFHCSSIPISFAGLPHALFSLQCGFGRYFPPFLPGIPRIALHPGDVSGEKGNRIRWMLDGWTKWGSCCSYKELSQKRQTNDH